MEVKRHMTDAITKRSCWHSEKNTFLPDISGQSVMITDV